MSTGRSRRNQQNSSSPIDAERAVELARNLVAAYPSIPRYRAALASAVNALADDVQADKPEEAEVLYAESDRLYKGLVESFSSIPVYRMLYASAVHDHSHHCRRIGDTTNARRLLQTAIAAQNRFVSARPDSVFGTSVLRRMENELESLTSTTTQTDSSGVAP